MTLRLVAHLLGVLHRLPYIVKILGITALRRLALYAIGVGFRLCRFLPGVLSGLLRVILGRAAQLIGQLFRFLRGLFGLFCMLTGFRGELLQLLSSLI